MVDPSLEQGPRARAQPDAATRPAGRCRWLLIGLIAVGGIVTSVLIYWVLRASELRLAEARFELSAQKRAEAVRDAVAQRLLAVNTLRAFFAASERVERREFRTLSESLLHWSSCSRALGWAPRVPQAQRIAHEQAARQEGLPDYRITQPDAQGRQWTFVGEATDANAAGQWCWGPIGWLTAGVLLTALLVGYLVRQSGRTARVEQLAAASTAEFRAISDLVLDAVVVVDAAGEIAHWNPAAERIFGRRRDEILGRPLYDTLVPQRYRDKVSEGLRHFAAEGQGPILGEIVELKALRKDGSEFPIEMSVSPIVIQRQRWAIAIIRDISARRRAEDEIRKDQRLLKELLSLQERERKLVAYEIHDGLAQLLTGAMLQLQALGRVQDQLPGEARAPFDDAMKLLGEGLAETRRLIGGLRPPVLDELGVIAAVEYLIGELQQRGGPEIEFSHQVRFHRLASPLESAVFRIVQESLTNATRHSQSAKVRVELVQHDDWLHVEVVDWGIGFDPAAVDRGRFGLRGIRERARLLGGAATIDAAPGKGTRILAKLPLLETGPNGTEPLPLT